MNRVIRGLKLFWPRPRGARSRGELRPRGAVRRLCGSLCLLGGLGLVYGLLAYGLMPLLWRHYEHQPALESLPKTTRTRDEIPGDSLNVGLVGSQAELVKALLAAGWRPADPISFGTSLGIARSVLLKHAYPTAPVSNLYLWGRPQDLAFEQPAGPSARQRHHVRWWLAGAFSVKGRPFWVGAATYDRSVGLSHRTGKITHHIAPDIDAERDKLFADLEKAGQLLEVYEVTGVGPTWDGRNGAGDRYYSDGELAVGILAPGNAVQTGPARHLPNPVVVRLKTTLWGWLNSVVN